MNRLKNMMIKGSKMERICKKPKDGKWYFWNDTWSLMIGPYKTRKEACIGFKKYCEEWCPD